MLHAERLKDVLRDVIVERRAGDALDDVAGQRGTVVGVGGNCAGGIDALRYVCDEILPDRHRLGFRPADEVLHHLLKAGRMRHEFAHGDWLGIGRGYFEIKIVVDVAIEVDFALLDELHDSSPSEELRDRAGTDQGAVGTHWCSLLYVGEAIALLEEDLAILDHDDDGPGDVLLL